MLNGATIRLGRTLQRLAGRRLGWPARFGGATLAVAAATVFRAAVGADSLPFLFYIPVVLFTGFRFGLDAGLYSVVLSAVAAAYFFIGPTFSFALSDTQWVAVAFFAVVNALIVAVTSVLRESLIELRTANSGLQRQVAQRTTDRDLLWQLSSDIMLVAEFDGTITDVNPAWTDVLGWSEEELIGRRYLDLIHPDDMAATGEAAQAIAAERRAYPTFENRYRRKAGDYRWITWSARPAEGFVLAVGRDITAAKEQADALQRTEQQLRQSQKMEAVGQLTGGLAHDFNNLLAGIAGALEMMKTRLSQGRHADLERYIAIAQGAADRAAALTHRLLAFSRRQTLDPKPTDIDRLVRGMEDLVRRTVGPGIALEVKETEGLWTALVDPNQLENSLLNLCINARDAMPDGGRLVIEAANQLLEPRFARERDMAPGAYLLLSVSDTGTGMDEATRARVFEPFFTTKPIGQGTGLGLSMVYGFVQQSGGQVRIHSEPGRGTTVTIYLPRHAGPIETAVAPTELADAPRATGGETVLVVDDEPAIRMLVADVLRELGYMPLEAGDGATGLQILRSDVRIDLLVTDVGLPGGMNGRQLAEAAREARPRLKVLFITGYAERAVLSHGHLEPGMQVITKPFAMEALASRVKALTGNQPAVP